MNPEHERRAGEIIKEDYPEANVTLSHKILPEIGEYERFTTAVISAYAGPSITEYILTVGDLLEKEGFKGQLLFMQNNGGVQTAEIARENPAGLTMSGPAAGPIAASVVGKLHDEENLISIDMGGTSFDCGIVAKGTFTTRSESLIADARFSLPVIDVTSVGAGGGSIAWLLRLYGPCPDPSIPELICRPRSWRRPTLPR